MIARVLVIAGSDSGGGAGVQADVKTITMLGGHATTAVTAVTAQNSVAVTRVEPVSTGMVLAQIDAVFCEIGADAVKIGMIGSAATARAVAGRLAGEGLPLVLDPVMVATSGGVLADADTVASFGALLRLATVATPNRQELAALGGEEAVLAHGCALLAKGGHDDGDRLTDRLLMPGEGEVARWTADRIDTPHTHGTGCTLASGVALGLAEGRPLVDAVARARLFVRLAIREAPGLGHGHGPMGHGRVRLDVAGAGTLNQVSLPAGDVAAARAFYRRLGLTPVVDTDHYLRFEADGGATLSLHDGPPTVYLECDELDQTIARLRGAGVPVEEPVDQPWLWREARLSDPAGNRLCLYRAGENRRFPPWRVP